MEPLVEVHTSEELARAIAAGAKIVGVNNRNLKTLDVRVETSFELIDQIPEDCIAVSESGIRTFGELAKLREAGFDAFLVGTRLMLSPDPAAALTRSSRRQVAGSLAAVVKRQNLRYHSSTGRAPRRKNSAPMPWASTSTRNRRVPSLLPMPGKSASSST